MRSFYFIFVWSILVVINGVEIQEGEIEHFLEIFVKETETNIITSAYFSTYNETLGSECLVSAVGKGTKEEWKITPLGDAFQIHSFVKFNPDRITVASSNELEGIHSQQYDLSFHNAFTYRNLIFVDNSKFTWSQKVLSKTPKLYDLCDRNVTAQFDSYFEENSTMCGIGQECFGPDKRCGINRDTGEVEIMDPGDQYMYKAFNFTIPWNCATTFCTFKDTDGNEFVIPEKLRTSKSSPAGKRIGLVPLLTTQSKIIRRKLNWLVDDSFTHKPAMLMSIGFFIVFWVL
ncbi:unnamed protein product [Bursaphelenchus okinawaensis]|uniref:Uncharacterized protein n=1 Tax=Bursaphelenchus okinawaensis TaxID=465554 RepID=A0A811JQ47_9BILA|nr:unnamed protein product [Bursaphelenchus okinawaensis]CAG9077574.1 unnamed protein product [Bursaphelenchus okinawaensis]